MNRNYLIIGASADIGLALIEYLNNHETDIQITAHYNSSRDGLKNIKLKNGNKLVMLQCDLADEDSIHLMIDNIKQNGIPDGLIHLSAPKLDYTKFKDIAWADCLYDLQVQVGSIFVILQEILPLMIQGETRAKVILMLSENTIMLPAKFTTKYTMSKYMLLGLLKSLTAEYRGKNVNINALSPTMIDTKLLSGIDRRMLEVSGLTDKMLKPKAVVPYIIKLLSKESDEMYGENIYISGGN